MDCLTLKQYAATAGGTVRRGLDLAGDWTLVTILAVMVTFPVAEVIWRELFRSGISGSIVTVQHLTLWIGFVGAMLAARDGRLLSLTGDSSWLPERWSTAAGILAGVVSVGVTVALLVASLHLVAVERAFPRTVLGPIQVWMAQAVMPVGFAVIAWQLLRRSSSRWDHRLIVVAGVALLAWLGMGLEWQGGAALYVGFAGLLLAVILGSPIYVILGGAAVLLFWNVGGVLAAIPAETYRIVVHPMLPTIPLFTLAGFFFAEGGASQRLVRVFRAWFGWIPGGTPVVAVLVCAFFTSFTGGSGVTILAMGGLLFPMLLKEAYSKDFSTGLLTASGSLGLLFPPSLPVILYGIRSQTPIDRLFLAGLLPGLLLMALLAAWGVRQGLVGQSRRTPFRWREALASVWVAKWEVFTPLIVLVGLFAGIATLVETAAITAIYAFIIQVFVYRDLRLTRQVIPTMVNCATLVGGVLIILGVAMGLTSYLVDAEVPTRALAWVQAHIHSKLVFLLALNAGLLLVGALMDIFSAIIVVVPLIAPMGLAFGIDPVHLGIIFLVNLELGYLTPPVGMNLFLSSYRFEMPLPAVYRSVVPYLIILAVGVLLISYVPAITLTIPNLLGR
ncbi:MAG: TRAP transporter large permease subunit [Candidatus Marinimicrobia bacterium]|nr:TRAP transporter large permease subunit [Candidatus Neomarinimicrobiota bacterium]